MKNHEIVKEINNLASEIKNEIKMDKYKKMKLKCNKLCEKRSELSKLDNCLGFPDDCSLSFFAYGIFKPGQVSFSRLKPYVDYIIEDEDSYIDYTLYERDGIPIVFEEDQKHKTYGTIIKFKQKDSKKAYDIIRKIESKTFYKWSKKPVDIKGIPVNMLFGKKQKHSNPVHVSDSYDGINDVFFKEAIALIASDMQKYEIGDAGFRNFFQLQRNYMLLWAAIERYNSLKYGENPKMENNIKLANEKSFKEALKLVVKKEVDKDKLRIVFNSGSLNPAYLDSDDAESSIRYYYTMRSNVVHRGKSVVPIDEENLRKSLLELLMIFQFVLKDTFKKYQIKKINYEISGVGLNNKLTLLNINNF